MNCPRCGKDSRVTETRTVPGNDLRRRRVCIDTECGHRFTTFETIVESNTRHNGAMIIVLPRHIARDLSSSLASLQLRLGTELTAKDAIEPELAKDFGSERSRAEPDDADDPEG